MFDACAYAIVLPVVRPVSAVEAPAPVGLAMHPPLDAFFFCPLSSPFVCIGLVAVDRFCVVHRGGRGHHAVHPSLRIAAHVGLHAKMPGVALLRAGHLEGPAFLPCSSSSTSHRFHVVEAVFHDWVAQGVQLLHEVDPEHHQNPDRAPAITRLRIVLQDGRKQKVPGKHRVYLTQKAFLARFLLLFVGDIRKLDCFMDTFPD